MSFVTIIVEYFKYQELRMEGSMELVVN